MDILNWLYLAKNKFVRASIDNPKDLMIFGAKVGANKRGDIYQNYAMEINDFAATLPAGPTGPQGVAGVAGPAGAPGPVGPAGLNWQGAWNGFATYVIDDAVGYAGASWFCINNVTSSVPPSVDTANWALLAAEGAPGATGATGLQGPTGPAGPSNVLSIGTVTTLSAGSSATATITGSSPIQTLNLGIPQGTAGSSPALVFVAKIYQSGANTPPTMYIKENTTAGTWTWTASGFPGIYNLTNPSYGAGTDVNRIAVFTTKDTSALGLITASYNGVNIQFRFIGAGWGALDNIIYGSSIEIRVYPS
jgi:hypothetical protein